jgi:uridylate kinase
VKKTTYNRILLKLSGESLASSDGYGIDSQTLSYFANEIQKVVALGVEVAVVLGGGNIFRGLSKNAENMDRVTADQMGMMATIINSLALQDKLQAMGVDSRVMTAVKITEVGEYFTQKKARAHLDKKRVVIIGGGTGNPFFTTDTAGVLRAVELKVNLLLKGTRVNGVYNADPEKVENAVQLNDLTYMEVIQKKLKVMDTTAITLSMENNLPIIVFNFNEPDNLKNIILGNKIGTKVRG